MTEEIIQIANIASNWWKDQLVHPIKESKEKFIKGYIKNLFGKMSIKEIDLNDLNNFQVLLRNKLVKNLNTLRLNTSKIYLDCEYEPCYILAMIALDTNIPLTNFPWNTSMTLSKNHVCVYKNNKREILYGNKIYYEFEIEDCKDYISYYSSMHEPYITKERKEELIKEYKSDLKEYKNKLKELLRNNQ